LLTIGCSLNVTSNGFKNTTEELPNIGLIIDNKNAYWRRGVGGHDNNLKLVGYTGWDQGADPGRGIKYSLHSASVSR